MDGRGGDPRPFCIQGPPGELARPGPEVGRVCDPRRPAVCRSDPPPGSCKELWPGGGGRDAVGTRARGKVLARADPDPPWCRSFGGLDGGGSLALAPGVVIPHLRGGSQAKVKEV